MVMFNKRGKEDDPGQRGKKSESDVQKFLNAYAAKHADFDWERRYDARSAGGRMHPQTYDYAFFRPGQHGGIEVKEVKHDFRLPHKNFENDQVGRLKKRQWAGGNIYVLVYHSTTQLWRTVPLHIFYTREGGSWDLTQWPTWPNCSEAMLATGYFD